MGNSVNRFAATRASHVSRIQGSLYFLPVLRSGSRQAGKRHLSYLNRFQGRELSTTSSGSPLYGLYLDGWDKVVQGHLSKPLSFSIGLHRPYSSGSHCFSEGYSESEIPEEKAVNKMDEGVTSVPNKYWNAKTCELYKNLTEELVEQEGGDWVEHQSHVYNGENRLFTKAALTELPGKFFEYALFFSKNEQRLKGVIQFGPYTQGPPGCVHGGASATIMDSAIGVCVNRSLARCVTATLTTNYKSFLPLGTTALVETHVDKVEGRKVFASGELKSPDGKVTYVTATAVFIQLDLESKPKHMRDSMTQWFSR